MAFDPTTNDSISMEVARLKAAVKKRSIFLIGLVVIFALLVIWLTRGSSSSQIKKLTADNKRLKTEMIELQKKASRDSAAIVMVDKRYDQAMQDRDAIIGAINNTSYLLGKFKPLYEKVNTYKSVPADSSLAKLFHEAFRER